MKKSAKIYLMAALVTTCCGIGWADIDNGSFETGNSNSWNTSIPDGGIIDVVLSHTGDSTGESWNPTDGDYFGLLKTPEIQEPTQLYQTDLFSAGDVLTFDYFFDAQSDSDGTFDEYAEGEILDSSNTSIANLFSVAISGVGDYGGTQWTSVSYTFATSGIYTVMFSIAITDGGSLNTSYLGIDNVKVALVPTPGAILLGSIGIGIVGWLRRRKTL